MSITFLTQEVKQKSTIIRAAMHFTEQGKNNIKTYREVFSQGQTMHVFVASTYDCFH